MTNITDFSDVPFRTRKDEYRKFRNFMIYLESGKHSKNITFRLKYLTLKCDVVEKPQDTDLGGLVSKTIVLFG